MSTTQAIKIVTMLAGADLSAKQFCFVKRSSGKVVACSAAGEFAIGVLMNKPDADGKPAEVALIDAGGIGKVRAGGSITAEAAITTANDGEAAAQGATADYYCNGFALETGADQRIISVLFARGNAKNPSA